MGQTPAQPARVSRPEILNFILGYPSTLVLESGADSAITIAVPTVVAIVSTIALKLGSTTTSAKHRRRCFRSIDGYAPAAVNVSTGLPEHVPKLSTDTTD